MDTPIIQIKTFQHDDMARDEYKAIVKTYGYNCERDRTHLYATHEKVVVELYYNDIHIKTIKKINSFGTGTTVAEYVKMSDTNNVKISDFRSNIVYFICNEHNTMFFIYDAKTGNLLHKTHPISNGYIGDYKRVQDTIYLLNMDAMGLWSVEKMDVQQMICMNLVICEQARNCRCEICMTPCCEQCYGTCEHVCDNAKKILEQCKCSNCSIVEIRSLVQSPDLVLDEISSENT